MSEIVFDHFCSFVVFMRIESGSVDNHTSWGYNWINRLTSGLSNGFWLVQNRPPRLPSFFAFRNKLNWTELYTILYHTYTYTYIYSIVTVVELNPGCWLKCNLILACRKIYCTQNRIFRHTYIGIRYKYRYIHTHTQWGVVWKGKNRVSE